MFDMSQEWHIDVPCGICMVFGLERYNSDPPRQLCRKDNGMYEKYLFYWSSFLSGLLDCTCIAANEIDSNRAEASSHSEIKRLSQTVPRGGGPTLDTLNPAGEPQMWRFQYRSASS